MLKIEQEIKELEGTTEIIDVDQLQTEKNRLSEQKKALEKEVNFNFFYITVLNK